ncbi:MAG: recombinase zinc beta ribbon domain-containing protein [Candidatus Methylomirabilales bacterium]
MFVRTRTEKRLDAQGKLVVRTRLLPREEWEVLIPDHHPGYAAWERWERIQGELRVNRRPPRGHAGGAVREGTALLQGRLRCGRCGRMMQTGYSGTKGNCPRYVCARAKQLYGGEQACQSLGGRRLDAAGSREHRVAGSAASLVQPDPQDGNGVGPQRRAALLPALAEAAHVRSGAQHDVLARSPVSSET